MGIRLVEFLLDSILHEQSYPIKPHILKFKTLFAAIFSHSGTLAEDRKAIDAMRLIPPARVRHHDSSQTQIHNHGGRSRESSLASYDNPDWNRIHYRLVQVVQAR